MPVHGGAPAEHDSCHGAHIFLGQYVDVLGNHIAIARLDARSLSVSIVSSGNEKKEVVDRAAVHDCTLSLWNLTGTPTPEGEIRWSNAAVWSRNGQSPSYVHRTSTEPKIAGATTAAVPPPVEPRVPVIGLIHSPDVAARSNNASVAVCMAGQLRTFLDPEVQIGYSEQLHHKGYEYFLSTDQYISFYDPRLRVKLQSIYVSESARPPTTACPPHTTNHRFLLPMASRLSHCYTLIQAEESMRAIRYSFVLRTRPDLAFSQRVLPLDQVFAASATEGAKLALTDDALGLAAREDAATLFLVPSIAYSLCAGGIEWSHACKRPIVFNKAQPENVPCCPMNLITFFGASRTWQPLLHMEFRLWRGRRDMPATVKTLAIRE